MSFSSAHTKFSNRGRINAFVTRTYEQYPATLRVGYHYAWVLINVPMFAGTRKNPRQCSLSGNTNNGQQKVKYRNQMNFTGSIYFILHCNGYRH
jgi:hypothetical protein